MPVASGSSEGDPNKSDQYRIIGIDQDFLDAFGLKLLKGRNFYPGLADSMAVLFNEAAIKKMGFAKDEDAINQKIEFWGSQYTIVGVVSNHHQESLQQDYDAHIFRLYSRRQFLLFAETDRRSKQQPGYRRIPFNSNGRAFSR